MVCACRRCGNRAEIRNTNNPENRVVRYRAALLRLAERGIVFHSFSTRKSLCLTCIEELFSWYENNRRI